MRKKKLNLQIISIFTVIVAAFAGSALFFFGLNTDMMKRAVEAETSLSSALFVNAIETDYEDHPDHQNDYMRTESDRGRFHNILSVEEDIGTDIDVWIVTKDGTILTKNGEASGENLFEHKTLPFEPSMLESAKEKGIHSCWMGEKGSIVLDETYCVIRPAAADLFLVIADYCTNAHALQRQQFALFIGIDATLLIIVIILIGNMISNYRRQLIRLATTDELTGLMNRKSFNVEFEEFARAEHRKPSSIFLLDIDFFKQINDTYGHAAGDNALSTLAAAIRDMINEHGGFSGRWGGDEFIGILFLPSEKAEEALNALCQRIRETTLPEDLHMTISIGVADTGTETSLVALSEKADLALYASKKAGRNQVTRYQPGMDALALENDGNAKRERTEAISSAAKPDAKKTASDNDAKQAPVSEPKQAEASVPDTASQAFKKRLSGYLHEKLIPSTLLGVRWMAPFVAGGGILIALAFVFDAASVDLSALSVEARASFGSITPLAATLKEIGGITFNFMLPIFAGFMAYGIAGEDAFMAGFVGGYMTIESNSGFVGAMIAGFAAGVLANEIQQFTGRLPRFIRKVAPIIIYPVFNLILMQAISWLVITPISGAVGNLFLDLLERAVSLSTVLAGGLSAMMMAIDMGGIVNKVAYNYGVNGLQLGKTAIMACVMAGGMVPPIGIFLSMVLFPRKYSEAEWDRSAGTLFMGLSFITEGALPYVFTDVFRVIPSCMAGSCLAGILSAVNGCTLPAPHGGVFVLPVMGHPFLYIVALAAGSLLTALLLGVWKKEVRETAFSDREIDPLLLKKRKEKVPAES